jgi:hypothetical protein
VEDGTVGLEIEALDVDQAAIAGLHQDRDPVLARLFAQPDLHHQIVALLEQDIEFAFAGEEHVEVGRRDAFGEYPHLRVGVDLEDLAGGEHRLVHADVVNARAQAIHVRELEAIEVREQVLAADLLERERDRRGLTDRKTDDAEPEAPQLRLLLRGDLVAVAAGAELAKLGFRQDAHEVAGPGVVDPSSVAVGIAIAEVSSDESSDRFGGRLGPRIARVDELAELPEQRVESDRHAP